MILTRKGNLPDIDAAGSLHQFLMKLHPKYGRIASFWYGKRHYVSFASPEAFKEHIEVFDRPLELFDFMVPIYGKDSVTITNGETVKRRRKHFDVPFGYAAVKKKYCHFHKVSDEMLAKLSALPAGEHIPFTEYMSISVLKAFSRASFGDIFDDEKKAITFLHNYDITWDILNKTIAADVEKNEEFNRALKEWKDLIRDVIELRRNNPPPDAERAIIDVLLEHCESEEHLLAEASTYLVDGFHTTVFMVVWVMYFMAQQPELQDRVCKEIVAVLGKETKVDFSNQSKLVYLRQVIDESIRLATITPFTTRADFGKDVEVQGYTIPKGVGVIYALGVVHLDPKIWPEPEKFDPDRFTKEKVSKRHKMAFSPFGIGKRMCPGYRMTYAEVSVFLADLFRSFKFQLVEGQVAIPKFGLVTQPREEIWLIATKRE
ncbi:cytochrome P450 20A1-like isoform X2 [Glandiceps talaboti]